MCGIPVTTGSPGFVPLIKVQMALLPFEEYKEKQVQSDASSFLFHPLFVP